MKKILFILSLWLLAISCFAAPVTYRGIFYGTGQQTNLAVTTHLYGTGDHITGLTNFNYDDLPYLSAGTNLYLESLGSGIHKTNRFNASGVSSPASVATQISTNASPIDWPSYFAQYPLEVPIRDFNDNYTNFDNTPVNLPRVIASSDGTVSYEGVVTRTSGNFNDNTPFFTPFGFCSPTNINNQSSLLFYGSVHTAGSLVGCSINGGDGSFSFLGSPVAPETLTFAFTSCTVPLLNPPFRGFLKTFSSPGVSNRLMVLVPYPRPVKNIKLAMMFVGNAADVFSYIDGPNAADYHNTNQIATFNFVNGLLTNGFTVAVPEGGTQYANMIGGNWGNSNSLFVNSNALVWLNSQFTITNTTLIGGSMGGLNALQMLANYPGITNCYGLFPVTSLTNAYRGEFTNFIETAYGFAGLANYVAATVNCDPSLLSTNLWAGKKFRATTSASDTDVPRAWLDAFTNRVNQPTRFTVKTASGPHGDATMIDFADFINWWTP